MQIFDYFLGTVSASGFAGFFSQLNDPDLPERTRIIKSGPGCGKSSMMRRLGERMVRAGYPVEYIHCSSDPDSLDGLVCGPLRFAIVDGTAPHVLEPAIPAAKQEVVSLYDTIDCRALTCNFEALRELFARNAAFHERAARFAGAAGSLFCEAERTARIALLAEKLDQFSARMGKRLFSNGPGGKPRETIRLSAGNTPVGYVDYTGSNLANYDNVYIFEDRWYAAAHRFLDNMRAQALAASYDVVVCRCPLSPYDKIDCVAVPALSLCFAASGFLSGVRNHGATLIREQRFYDPKILSSNKNRLTFSKNAVIRLLEQASALLAEAKAVHDDIERIYSVNIDFSKVREREAEILDSLGLS